jgi:hypothetical protein
MFFVVGSGSRCLVGGVVLLCWWGWCGGLGLLVENWIVDASIFCSAIFL